MTKRNRDPANRPNSPDQYRLPNEQIKAVCMLIIYLAVAATLLAWAMDRPGAICWAVRRGGPLILLLAIGLMRRFENRTVDAPGDPRERLRKRGTVLVVAKPNPTTDRRSDDTSPSSVPTEPRGFRGLTVIGIVVLGFALLTALAPVLITEGIRAMVTQTAVVSIYIQRSDSDPKQSGSDPTNWWDGHIGWSGSGNSRLFRSAPEPAPDSSFVDEVCLQENEAVR